MRYKVTMLESDDFARSVEEHTSIDMAVQSAVEWSIATGRNASIELDIGFEGLNWLCRIRKGAVAEFNYKLRDAVDVIREMVAGELQSGQ